MTQRLNFFSSSSTWGSLENTQMPIILFITCWGSSVNCNHNWSFLSNLQPGSIQREKHCCGIETHLSNQQQRWIRHHQARWPGELGTQSTYRSFLAHFVLFDRKWQFVILSCLLPRAPCGPWPLAWRVVLWRWCTWQHLAMTWIALELCSEPVLDRLTSWSSLERSPTRWLLLYARYDVVIITVT